jgi:hypothetical protein
MLKSVIVLICFFRKKSALALHRVQTVAVFLFELLFFGVWQSAYEKKYINNCLLAGNVVLYGIDDDKTDQTICLIFFYALNDESFNGFVVETNRWIEWT